jgi:septin 7
MTDSYISSRTGDLSPNTNGGSLPNGSNPSLPGNIHGVTPIIRKKLMGYVGFANLPNQVHRKSVRKGFQFTMMVVGSSHQFSFLLAASLNSSSLIGESGLGKSTLVNTLFNTMLYPPKEPPAPNAERPQTVAIQSISAGKESPSSSITTTPH